LTGPVFRNLHRELGAPDRYRPASTQPGLDLGQIPNDALYNVSSSELLGMVEGPRMRMGQISAQQKSPGRSSERPGHFKCCRTKA
jgi:hypothetical protein